MGESLTELSARLIDERITDEPPNRVTQELSELADGVALVESFSHVLLVDTEDGLVAFDSSGQHTGAAVVEAVRGWSDAPVLTLVYTHGHADHVGGSPAFAADAEAAGRPRPEVVGHAAVTDRLDRYRRTDGYNLAINLRQFGGVAPQKIRQLAADDTVHFVPDDVLPLDVAHEDGLVLDVGGVELELHHAKGETDDHTWTWIPSHRMISAGDLFIWNFPNCGNPQKVQRYPREWVEALRAMAAKEAELFVPAHGLPIAGVERIQTCLTTVADTLERLLTDVLDAMNTGAPLDEVVAAVSVDDDALALPFLRPLYDEPEFVVRNIWRLYGGWWDGNMARLKPASDQAVGTEVARLAGGALALARRARELSDEGDHRLACQLVEFAAAAEPASTEVHALRSEIYWLRRGAETSLMAKGIFATAKAESDTVVSGEAPPSRMNLDLDAGD